jgi:hypothetical protein
MPKRKRTKDSEYLRFRPYKAFTTPPANSQSDRQTTVLRALLIVGAGILLLFAALSLKHP